MHTKQRLSASVDSDLIEAAEEAVRRGLCPSVSAWVNDALHLKLDQQRRLEALTAFVAAYESQHGEISVEEMEQAARHARARALVTRRLPEPQPLSLKRRQRSR